ncbi:MAG: hypothetical protein IKP00_04455 [Victivallales bacterium]|nr:hypothetical protein [Victivallales bacterium]
MMRQSGAAGENANNNRACPVIGKHLVLAYQTGRRIIRVRVAGLHARVAGVHEINIYKIWPLDWLAALEALASEPEQSHA